jgi:hypothetical protein
MSGKDIAISIQFLDERGKTLTSKQLNNEIQVKVTSPDWKLYTLRGTAPEKTVSVRVLIHTFKASKTIVDIDEVTLYEIK